jgi:hypothetical protein
MATFRYTLRTPDAAVKFGTESVRNWQDVKPSMVKNETYRGVFQSMTSTLEFVGVIRDLIIRTIDAHGYDAEIFLTVEIGNNNRERSSFEVFEGMEEMKAELSEVDITELSVSLNFVESGFVADILNREDVKVNLDLTETIDGEPLPPYSDLLMDLYLHDRKLIFNSLLETKEQSYTYDAKAVILDYALPLSIVYRSDDNFKNVIEQEPYLVIIGDAARTFYLQSDLSRSIAIKINIDCTLSITGGDIIYGWFIRVRRVRDGNTTELVTLASSVFFSGPYLNLGVGNNINVTIDYFANWDVQEGDSYSLMFRTAPLAGTGADSQDVTVAITDLSIEGVSLESFEPTVSKSIPPHELFERLIHTITGEPNAFYSDYFGRTALGYSKTGEGAYLTTLNGLMLRNFPDDKTKFNTSFKEAFEAFSKEKNLVGTIETINNRKVFRIEKYSDVYAQEVILKLGAVSEVSRSIDFEKIFTEIKTGGGTEEYEEVNGLFSFNGEFTFAAPMKTSASILNLIGPYRKDDIGIELTRRLQYVLDPNKDYRADEDIFIIDSKHSNIAPGEEFPVYNGKGVLIANRAEGFENIEGIYEPSRAYNLNLSPKRQLLLWGSIIASGLLQKSDKSLKFVKGAKNQDLITKKFGEAELVESGDILIQSLDSAIVLPDLIMIAEAKMDFEQYKLLARNPTKLVEFNNKGVQIFGYILSTEFDFERNVCNFELERANY